MAPTPLRLCEQCCADGTILHYSSVSEDEDGDDDNDGNSAPPGDGAHRQAPTAAPTGTAMTAGGAITATAAMVMFYMPAEREDDGEPSSEEETE